MKSKAAGCGSISTVISNNNNNNNNNDNNNNDNDSNIYNETLLKSNLLLIKSKLKIISYFSYFKSYIFLLTGF